jgi:hypothetical protein
MEKTEKQRSDERSCPKCGMERSKWSASNGFSMSGQQYCCSGCAQDTGCSCQGASKTQGSQMGREQGRGMSGGTARA